MVPLPPLWFLFDHTYDIMNPVRESIAPRFIMSKGGSSLNLSACSRTRSRTDTGSWGRRVDPGGCVGSQEGARLTLLLAEAGAEAEAEAPEAGEEVDEDEDRDDLGAEDEDDGEEEEEEEEEEEDRDEGVLAQSRRRAAGA